MTGGTCPGQQNSGCHEFQKRNLFSSSNKYFLLPFGCFYYNSADDTS